MSCDHQATAQGLSGTVIPEFVQRVNYEKGPYYADVGNYGSAGSAHLDFYKTLPQNFVQVEGGMYSYCRAVFGASQKLGLGNLLFGGEAYHDDGPWTHPDNYYKFNGLLTYSQGDEANGFSITRRGYHGNWHSSDRIPVTAVPLVDFFGALNPSLHEYKAFSASLRLRYFGPRDLTSDGVYRSEATALLNGEVAYRFNRRWRFAAELLNLPNRRDHDIDYAYTSQITPSATPAFTDVFHPVEPFQVRFGLVRTF